MAERVAFSVPINMDLLNEVYEEYSAGLTKAESQRKLDDIISQGISSGDNIRKTRTICQNLWYDDSDWLHAEALCAAKYLTREERMPVHWALIIKHYPIFTDVCAVLGQLFEIKDSVSAGQIKDEIFRKWGARYTLNTSLSKILKSLRDMGALTHGNGRTTYVRVSHKVADPKVVALLFAAVMLATEQQYMTWESFITHPAIFPFTINDVTQADMAAVPYLTMERMGEQVVFRAKNMGA